MSESTVIVATSSKDKDGHIITLDALNSLVDQINSKYIPVNMFHDPRIPPKGRFLSSRLVELKDGVIGVEAVMELFDDRDKIEIGDTSREIPIRNYHSTKLELLFDKNFKDRESQQIINEMGKLFGTQPGEHIKKSIDPLATLIVGGAFIAGAYFNGFFSKMGSDSWDFIKSKLIQLLNKQTGEDKLMVFDFTTLLEDSKANIEIIITNPTEEDIESFINHGIRTLDTIIPNLLDTECEVRELVFEYKNQELNLLFKLRRDGVPILPS